MWIRKHDLTAGWTILQLQKWNELAIRGSTMAAPRKHAECRKPDSKDPVRMEWAAQANPKRWTEGAVGWLSEADPRGEWGGAGHKESPWGGRKFWNGILVLGAQHRSGTRCH